MLAVAAVASELCSVVLGATHNLHELDFKEQLGVRLDRTASAASAIPERVGGWGVSVRVG